MALALDIPLIACSTLDCMAYPWSPWPALVLPVLDAKKNRFFTALYAGGRRISEEMDAELPAIIKLLAGGDPVLLTGPGAPMFLSRLNGEGAPGKELLDRLRPDPLCRRGHGMELAALAKERITMNNKENDVLSAPEYLRESDADAGS
jgi:tRNA threonylcarbamoyladenosine biosynthesis protein TsaB